MSKGTWGVRTAGAVRGLKKTPDVIGCIAELLKHETAGDPMSHLKWTRKTTGKIAVQLQRLDIQVCPKTVSRLLYGMGYSLRVNHKTLESGNKNPPPAKYATGSSTTSARSARNLPPATVRSSASIRKRKN